MLIAGHAHSDSFQLRQRYAVSWTGEAGLRLRSSSRFPVDFPVAERLNPAMPLLSIADRSTLECWTFESATSWYIDKLGLQKVPAEMDDSEGCIALGFSKRDQTCIAVLGPRDKPTTPPTSGRRRRS
jgi:hypothetical protein